LFTGMNSFHILKGIVLTLRNLFLPAMMFERTIAVASMMHPGLGWPGVSPPPNTSAEASEQSRLRQLLTGKLPLESVDKVCSVLSEAKGKAQYTPKLRRRTPFNSAEYNEKLTPDQLHILAIGDMANDYLRGYKAKYLAELPFNDAPVTSWADEVIDTETDWRNHMRNTFKTRDAIRAQIQRDYFVDESPEDLDALADDVWRRLSNESLGANVLAPPPKHPASLKRMPLVQPVKYVVESVLSDTGRHSEHLFSNQVVISSVDGEFSGHGVMLNDSLVTLEHVTHDMPNFSVTYDDMIFDVVNQPSLVIPTDGPDNFVVYSAHFSGCKSLKLKSVHDPTIVDACILNRKTFELSTGKIVHIEHDIIQHTMNTLPGYSGALIVQGSYVVGMHCAGGTTENTALSLAPVLKFFREQNAKNNVSQVPIPSTSTARPTHQERYIKKYRPLASRVISAPVSATVAHGKAVASE